MAIDRTACTAGDAVADPAIRLSFLLSIWINSPGPLALVEHRRRLRFQRASLPRPSWRRIVPTVETGMPSWRAIIGPLMRCRRKPVISLIRCAAIRWLQHTGAELRSHNAAAPPLRRRAS
jgi:hypothetical protein